MPNTGSNALLGYPDDARLLLINADDFGMYQDINEGIIRAFKEGVVRSTSLMTPCPGAEDAMRILVENPDYLLRRASVYHPRPTGLSLGIARA